MLASYQKFSNTDRKRANDYGIKIVADNELVTLKNKIKSWIK